MVIKNTFLFLVFSIVYLMDEGIVNPETDILEYENYTTKTVNLPDLKIGRRVNGKKLFSDNCFALPYEEKVEGSLYDSLTNIEIINDWKILSAKNDPFSPYPSEYKRFVEARQKEITIFFLGEIKCKHQIESYLFQMREEESGHFKNRRLIRINTKYSRITSIVILAYEVSDGLSVCKSWTDKKGETYIFKKTLESKDLIYSKKAIKDILRKDRDFFKQKTYFTDYSIDEFGFVIIKNKKESKE